MSRVWLVAILGAAALVHAPALSTAGDDVLKVVPNDALAVVLFNRIAALDGKLQSLGQQLQAPIPSPLARLKEKSGLRQGLDEKGTIALVVLPPKEGERIPSPILLVPVTDYAEFLKPFNVKKQPGPVKIELGGMECWVRGIGSYAALADPPRREALERSWEVSKEIPKDLLPWQGWLRENDVAAVALPAGTKFGAARVRETLGMLKGVVQAVGQEAGEAAAVSFEMYGRLFDAVEKQTTLLGFAIRLEKRGALRLLSRAQLVPGSTFARIAGEMKPAGDSPLAGLPDVPFVVAGGGPIPQAAWEPMTRLSIDLMKSAPKLYGLNAEQAEKITRQSLDMMRQVHGMSIVMGVGTEGTSLLSETLGVMRVDKATAFMDEYEKAMRRYSETAKGINSRYVRPPKVQATRIGDAPGLELTVEVPAPPGKKPPNYDRMMESMFGPGGKITVYVAPAGEQYVVFGYVNKASVEKVIRAIQDKEKGLAGNAEVAKTRALLPKGAAVVGYWSPQGTVRLVNRLIPGMLPAEVKRPRSLPDFPATPPIGFAVVASSEQVTKQLVVPAEVLKAIGQYVRGFRKQPDSL